jgi:hypothetical protein
MAAGRASASPLRPEPHGWWAESPELDGRSLAGGATKKVRRLVEDGVPLVGASGAGDPGDGFDAERFASVSGPAELIRRTDNAVLAEAEVDAERATRSDKKHDGATAVLVTHLDAR